MQTSRFLVRHAVRAAFACASLAALVPVQAAQDHAAAPAACSDAGFSQAELARIRARARNA